MVWSSRAIGVVLHGSLLGHIKAKLPFHGLKLVSCFIHASILLQFCPAVNRVAGNLFEIGLIRFGCA